jgi:(4S)-4-hydroxy-5-phosphonooxypentane-2,3-dione isomerase
MFVNYVQIHVKPECVEAFKEATIANALASRREPGIAQFDCLQQEDDPTRFVLVEAFREANAQAAHRGTSHYQIWRDAVAPMMAEPRASTRFAPVTPIES